MKHSVEKHVRHAQTLGFVEKLHCRSRDTGGGMQLRTVPSTVLQEWAVCCMSTNVEDIGRMTEGVMRVFRQEVGRPHGDERTRSQAHVILQLT